MPEIFQYTDYRAYLRDWFEYCKSELSYMSYRYLARRTGIDAGYLAHVFQGDKHLSDAAVEKFVVLMRLKAKAARYFAAMVQFNKARRAEDIRERFEKLMALRESGVRILNQQEYRYWMHWYIPAVRLSLLNGDFRGDVQSLARRITPPVTEAQVREALDILLSLGLIRIREDGIYEVLDAHLSTGDAWSSAAIREFQRKTLELAQESLLRHPPELREIATLTLAIPREEIPALQEMMRDFRARVAKWAVAMEHSDCVMQLNLACFPLSLPMHEKISGGGKSND